MIDDGYVASEAERIAYEQGRETLARFNPLDEIVGISPDGNERRLNTLERATNEVFLRFGDLARVEASGRIIVRQLLPIAFIEEGEWIEQSLFLSPDGRLIQHANFYKGMTKWPVSPGSIMRNGQLWTGRDGKLKLQYYSEERIREVNKLRSLRLASHLRKLRPR
ncbi:hypothetical protein KC960_04025 [Candidatus Saccharibacteria bacterium]|nr:hypothetical protein [Candidatus Saccharibacteria bacterium]